MKNANILLILTSALLWPLPGQTQADIFGKWKSIDDKSGEAKSIIEIYNQQDKAFGKITQLLQPDPDDPDPLCDKCKDYRKDKRIIGMNIITDMVKDGKEWIDGEILDPENGKVYRCKLWIEDNTLKVRGYVGFIYRTQTWYKAD